MKNRNKQAFTLIELLVVVLIIGILAAVAVPQYKMAVAKSRVTQLRVRVDALYKAAQVYKLQNGVWPTDVRDLDIDITQDVSEFKKSDRTSAEHIAALYKDGGLCGVHVSPSGNETVWCYNDNVTINIIRRKEQKDELKLCEGQNDLGTKICQSMS
ncbi:MAG: prepilin-type N-terminal cleavage/methylation domain-containing protein [Elusimicrobiaceae bacterium]|nr:prepilin-type N-terminal cleavage/methylation domain-containing protein [Elusimicrobiaceae bacterium]